MRTVIYYFSGTGNSLKIARDISKNIKGSRIAPMSSVKAPDNNADCIGVVFPAYFGGLPLYVREFLAKIRTKNYVFAVANFGAISGASLAQANEILKKNRTKLNAGFLIQMPDSYIDMFEAPLKEDMRRLFSQEEKKTLLISGVVNNRENIPLEKNNPLFNFFITPYYKSFSKRIKSSDKSFWTMDKCNGCGVCSRICQYGNIEMKDKRPSWKHKCEQCYACIQFCPKEAIQRDKSTFGKRRYHNPYVKPEDISGKILNISKISKRGPSPGRKTSRIAK